MSNLAMFGEHARTMATAQHKPECLIECLGCVTDADRALWAQIAAEIEAYLNHDEEAGLFE